MFEQYVQRFNEERDPGLSIQVKKTRSNTQIDGYRFRIERAAAPMETKLAPDHLSLNYRYPLTVVAES